MSRIRGNLKERTLTFGENILNAISHLPEDARGRIVAQQLGRSGNVDWSQCVGSGPCSVGR